MLACLREGRDQLLAWFLQIDHWDLHELAPRQVDRIVVGCHPQAASASGPYSQPYTRTAVGLLAGAAQEHTLKFAGYYN
jgi:hypothetical protein